MNCKRWYIIGPLSLLLMTAQSYGQTVAWGGSGSFSPLSFDSRGNQDLSNHVWELGWFTDGYTPTATNFATWAANWHSVDVGSFKEFAGGLYSANEIVDNPGAPSVGKKMYTFVHNGGSSNPAVWGPLMGTPAGEALLYTLGLTFLPVPAPTVSFNIANNPLDAADDSGFKVIWGRVDRNMYLDSLWGGTNTPASPVPPNGGVIWTAGVISNPIPDSQETPYDELNGTFENQTATWQGTSPWADFVQLHFSTNPGISSPEAKFDFDYDRDGIPNGVEYALGTNPAASNGGLANAPRYENNSFTFLLKSPLPTDLALVIQASDTLEGNSWTMIATRPAGGAWSGPVTQTSVGAFTRIDLSESPRPRRFYRLYCSIP